MSLSRDNPPFTTQTPTQNNTTPVSGDAPSPGNIIGKNKIVDGFFGEEVEMCLDGEEALSFGIQNGKPKIKISPKVLDELRHQCKNCLIVKLFGKTINYDTLCSKVRALWKLRGDFKALDLGEKYFSFTFESFEDYTYVYTKGPWVVMDHLLSVRKWEPNFKPSEARRIMRTAVWVRFRELPLEFLNDKILYILSKSLGMPIKVDHRTHWKFARVCIEIDLGKPLYPVIDVEGKDCVIEYESLQSFCFNCCRYGHIKDISCNGATILEKTAPKTNKFEGCSEPIEDSDLNKVKSKKSEKGNNGKSAMKNGEILEANGRSSPKSSSDLVTNSEIYDYPDPDFNDFDKERGVDCFEVGQIWALYDTMGGMPRFYVRVNRIISRSSFKLRITWLEPDPCDENESKWVDAGLPVSCGNLRKGDTETIDDRLMFSHRVDWEKGSKRDPYKIYPRKGETWALFKNWNMNWHSNPEFNRNYEFEFVVILSEYHGDTGVSVAYLSKIKGFSCLFCRTSRGVDSFQIQPSKMLRFSHRVPSFRLSGEERDDVPKNSFELDPASLSSKIKEIDFSKDPKDQMELGSEGNSKINDESPEACEIPESEYFNFDGERSPDIEEVHITHEVDDPCILSGDREFPFTSIASLSAKLATVKDKTSYVQGKIKCFLTGLKDFHFRQREKFELHAYVDDGSDISEILIDHNLVQKRVGHSPQEFTAALSSSDPKRVSEMLEILRQFEHFFRYFEGTMLVQISEASPFPTVMEMNQGCSTSDAWSLLRRLKSFNSNQPQQHPSVEPINLSATISEKTAPKTKKKINKEKQKEAEKGNDGISAMKNGGKINVEPNGGSSPSSSCDPEIYEYPDPDFNDFDKERGINCFKVGQVWALYDTMGGMPRLYARVSRILSRPAFKLKITWLEPNPDDKNESKWVNAGLPVSCGNLRKGDTETTNERLMFSHRVDWEKGSKRDTYKIYPQKGETWALFKDWNMNWHSNPERKYEFEFVELLSDYNEGAGVSVAYLSKIKGFSCLFCRTPSGGDSIKISRSHLFRFSHRIPSFLLSGEERDDVPKDSFELDPASLPSNIKEIDNPKPSTAEVETVVISESHSPVCEVKNDMESDSEENSDSSEDSPEAFEIPDPEFFNFDAEKSPEKFQPGQFWALYGDENGLPKYYAFIKKVDHEPQFELHVTWLEACPSKNSLKYVDKLMPIGCGMFKHTKSKALSYTDTSIFSHLLNVKPTDKMDEFAIYPRKGEVWAVYKNWRMKMTRSDLKNCKYDIVEILEENDLSVKGVVLEMVDGHNLVFKARKNNGSLATVQIDQSYMLKFSHQIPSFRLTEEKGGSLNGCWELDPAALPIEMFCSR